MKTPIASLFLVLVVLSSPASAQRFFTKGGTIYFNASGPSEVIEATNKTATCVMDVQSGAIQFAVMMKGFLFEKALMEEHFNENYVESSKFPKAEFKGEFTNKAAINFGKDGTYPAHVKGKLTLHGVTKEIETDGSVTIKDGKPQISAEFKLILIDYGVEIPSLVSDKVSKEAKIKVNCSLEPLKG
jgi:polyisoprenoid-binding protein YceI